MPISTSFACLPNELQSQIADYLTVTDLGRLTCVSKDCDALVAALPTMQTGRRLFNPHPELPAAHHAILKLLSDYTESPHDLVRAMQSKGQPFDAAHLFQSSLDMWVEQERLTANTDAERIAQQLSEAYQTKISDLSIEETTISSLPRCIGRLTSLETLFIWGAPNLQYLPETLHRLSMLRFLAAQYTGLQALPVCMAKMPQLDYLDLQHSAELRYLPQAIEYMPKLKVLWVGFCSSLQTLPELLPAKHLSSLQVTGCRQLDSSAWSVIERIRAKGIRIVTEDSIEWHYKSAMHALKGIRT